MSISASWDRSRIVKERCFRGVAQPGLEYASGGRVVASSNLVTPTTNANQSFAVVSG